MVLLLIIALGLLVRIWQIGSLPAEMWGDVITHYQLVHDLLSGHIIINYQFGGDGPLFNYLAAGVTAVYPLSFNSLMLTSDIIGTLLIPAVYFYTQSLFRNKTISRISSFLTAVSFWSLTFSRQGKPYILIPVFTALGLGLLINKRRLMAGVVLGLGTYTQAAYWGFLPFLFFHPITFLSGLIIILPFMTTIIDKSTPLSSGSYIGSKLLSVSFVQFIPKFLDNIKNNFLSFWMSSDLSFRYTILNHPYLDPVSGILFAIGLIIIIYRIINRKSYFLFLYCLLPFVLIQIPSLLDVSTPYSTPNMGRMIGIIPIVFAISAYALYTIVKKSYLIILITILIAVTNLYNYFYIYPKTLPEHNTPFGKIIAEYIDSNYPARLPIVLNDCCWGQAGQPEPNGILYRLKSPRPLYYRRYPPPPYILIQKPAVLIYPYADITLVEK